MKTDTEIETYNSVEELKCPLEYEEWVIIILDEIKGKKRMMLEYRHCLKDLDRKVFLSLSLVKITTNYQNEALQLLVLFINFLNHTISKSPSSLKKYGNGLK